MSRLSARLFTTEFDLPAITSFANDNGFASRAIRALVHSVLFVAIYGGCLHLTGTRQDVGQLYSSWELHIPLVPAMIMPYFSIYPLFIMAFFMCRDGIAARELSLRISGAQLVAGFVYLAFPLQSGFSRPAVEGAYGPLFQLLEATDLPYNLAPSLHVTTAIILGSVFCRESRGVGRWILASWFGLICVSTLLTWQHHVVDVVSGALLGLLSLECFSIERRSASR